jgi:hypothetical protein
MSLYQCILGTPQWLGRCSQLESSAARCLINDFPAFHGRQNDQVTVRWHSKRYWQTYRHTWSYRSDAIPQDPGSGGAITSVCVSLYHACKIYLASGLVCCSHMQNLHGQQYSLITTCSCLTVFLYLHSFHPVYREVDAIHVCLHQAVGTDGPPLFPDCLNAISSSRVVRFPRYLCLCTRPSVPMLCLGVPSA